ncbi:alpha-L-rhamnosidase C-terminal domain-containing protein [Nonomuraea dietziae]|uniref:alpha-L-rhamnosidase C-terminal domain-containing protein n=1 Tax=Nonomuraea dietziae TaxID=65515 RepID=UPI0034041EAF
MARLEEPLFGLSVEEVVDFDVFCTIATNRACSWDMYALYRHMLAPAAPGYRRLLVRPRPGGGLTRARAVHRTPYGHAEVSWQRTGEYLELRVVVPPNTTVTVHRPTEPDAPIETGSGTHVLRCAFRAPATLRDEAGRSPHASQGWAGDLDGPGGRGACL